jgi:hypothetical protein
MQSRTFPYGSCARQVSTCRTDRRDPLPSATPCDHDARFSGARGRQGRRLVCGRGQAAPSRSPTRGTRSWQPGAVELLARARDGPELAPRSHVCPLRRGLAQGRRSSALRGARYRSLRLTIGARASFALPASLLLVRLSVYALHLRTAQRHPPRLAVSAPRLVACDVAAHYLNRLTRAENATCVHGIVT